MRLNNENESQLSFMMFVEWFIWGVVVPLWLWLEQKRLYRQGD